MVKFIQYLGGFSLSLFFFVFFWKWFLFLFPPFLLIWLQHKRHRSWLSAYPSGMQCTCLQKKVRRPCHWRVFLCWTVSQRQKCRRCFFLVLLFLSSKKENMKSAQRTSLMHFLFIPHLFCLSGVGWVVNVLWFWVYTYVVCVQGTRPIRP